jgi:DNA-binding MarR family transcriptional regulator
MRYLEGESLTQTQLALRLKLRTSTVAHHLKNLRAAGLVNIQFSVGNKKEVFYSTRTERLDGVCKMLSDFVKQSDGGKKP